MQTVLICDDEKRVCQLINKLIRWNELDLRCLGMVYDGIEAYNTILEQKPDIVITDIRMPGMNGLELLEKIKQEGLDTKIIIISGYKEFEYAHRAIKNGVEDYLVKPINKDELNLILKKIKDQFISLQETKISTELLNKRFEQGMNLLREQFIQELCNNESEMGKLPIDTMNDLYNLNFNNGIFQAAVIHLDCVNQELGDAFSRNKILNKINEYIEEKLKPLCLDALTTVKNNDIICIFNFEDNAQEQIDKLWYMIYESGSAYLNMQAAYMITVGIGLPKNNFERVKYSIVEAHEAIQRRIIYGTNRIIEYIEHHQKRLSPNELITPDMMRELAICIESLELFSLKKWLKNIFQYFSTEVQLDAKNLFELSQYIMELILNRIESNNMIKIEKQELLSLFNSSLQNMYEVVQLPVLIYQISEKPMEQCIIYKNNQSEKPIRIAKGYVEKHYNENISLADVAEEVHLNPVYFSVLFKKEVGMNFIDFLLDFRIEVAKKLLLNTNDNLGTIAQNVGYKDARYFSKLFFKRVGIKPGEFRKLYV